MKTAIAVIKGIVIFTVLLSGLILVNNVIKANKAIDEANKAIQEAEKQIEESRKLMEEQNKKTNERIDNVKKIYDTKISSLNSEITNANKLLKGKLAGKAEIILKAFSTRNIGKLVIAVSCAESSCGMYECGSYNYWGIMSNGRCMHFKSLEHALSSIKKFVGKYYNQVDQMGITHENLQKVFVGQGKYCTSGCTHWAVNTFSSYKSI